MTRLVVALEDGTFEHFEATSAESRALATRLGAERALENARRLLGDERREPEPSVAEKADAILAEPKLAEALGIEPDPDHEGTSPSSSTASRTADQVLDGTPGLAAELGITRGREV